jgi:hypothetical protein
MKRIVLLLSVVALMVEMLALERPCVVALKAAKWRSWLCFDHFWSPEWSLSGISRQSLEDDFSELRRYPGKIDRLRLLRCIEDTKLEGAAYGWSRRSRLRTPW